MAALELDELRALLVERVAQAVTFGVPPAARSATWPRAWVSPSNRLEIHGRARGVYGARRVHAELRHAYGVRIGRKRVERLMREVGLSGLIKRRRGRTTIRVPGVRVADDLVGRRFFREGRSASGSPTSPTCPPPN